MSQSLFEFDDSPFNTRWQAGVDEVGIGPLAGPVVAAAVILDPTSPIDGLADSKTLNAKRREMLAEQIRQHAMTWCLGFASVVEIDQMNILRASHLAMQRAVAGLIESPEMVMVDGNKTPQFGVPCVAVVQGDKRIPQISAASILAKVARDQTMRAYAQRYPGFGFEKNMGYPTKQHFAALQNDGATPIHRRSFAPVRAVLDQSDPESLGKMDELFEYSGDVAGGSIKPKNA
ncbi:MAG: ribonuclease HII [Pseudomonadota bacterium]